MNLDRARRLLQLSRQKLSTKRKDANPSVIGYDASSGKYQIQSADGTIRDLASRTSGSLGLGETGFIQGRAIAQKPHVKRVDERKKYFPRIVPTGGFYRFCYYYDVEGSQRIFIGGDRETPIDLETHINNLYSTSFDFNADFWDGGSYFATMNTVGSGIDDWVLMIAYNTYTECLVAYGNGAGYYSFSSPDDGTNTFDLFGSLGGWDTDDKTMHSGYNACGDTGFSSSKGAVTYNGAIIVNDDTTEAKWVGDDGWTTSPSSFRNEPAGGDVDFFNFWIAPNMDLPVDDEKIHSAIGYGIGVNPYTGTDKEYGGWTYHKYGITPQTAASKDVIYIESLTPELDDPDDAFSYDTYTQPYMSLYPDYSTGFSESRQQIYHCHPTVRSEAFGSTYFNANTDRYGITGQLNFEEFTAENGLARVKQTLLVRPVTIYSWQIPDGVTPVLVNFNYFNENP